MTPLATSLSRIVLATLLAAALCLAMPIHAEAQGFGADAHARVIRDAHGAIEMAHGRLAPAQTGEPVEIARSFLREEAYALGLTPRGVELELLYVRDGAASLHVRFRQVVEGRPVEGGEVFVHMTCDGAIQTVQNRTFATSLFDSATFTLDREDAIEAASEILDVRGALRAPAEADDVWFATEAGLRPAWRVTLAANEPLGDWTILIDARNGAEFKRHNCLQHATGAGRVFSPDPVRTSGNTDLRDQADADQPELTAELRTVLLENLDESGYVRGRFADARSSKGRAWSPTKAFHFTRSSDHFEEVMFYYHVDRCQSWFEELGIYGANRRRQIADVHGTTHDNSFYSPTTKRITFGDGGVDDAEDADIILHEYGHAIQDNQVSGWGQSHESAAMGEGFGDWLATTFFSGPEYGDRHDAVVADWDATHYSNANPPNLRRVDRDKVYPYDMEGSVHADGEIWSRALWDLRWFVGRDISIQLVLEGHFYCTPYSTFREGALGVLAADEALFDGRYRFAIREAFLARGILTNDDIPEIADDKLCRVGTVRAERGTYEDVLAVNGSAGVGDTREVTVPSSGSLQIDVSTPSGHAKAKYVLYGWIGSPNASTVAPQPYQVGTMCFNTLITGGNPDVIWNNIGHVNKAGTADHASEAAPFTIVQPTIDVMLGAEVTLQGFIENYRSTAKHPISITNAVVLRAD